MGMLEIAKWDALFQISNTEVPLSMVSSSVTSFQPTKQFEEGSIQIDYELSRMPPATQLALPFISKNLSFLYQPPLTQKEIVDGASRPPEIEGSYAAYHSWRRNNEFECGKIFHLPRPDIHDVDGKTDWCTLLIENGQIKVALPIDFLKTAKYPVSVGQLIFGKTGVGASTKSESNRARACVYLNDQGAGTASKVTARVWAASTFNMYGGVYDVEVAEHPDNRLGVSSAVSVGTSEDWVDFALSASISNATKYGLAFAPSDGTGVNFKYDAGTTAQTHLLQNQWSLDALWGTCDGHSDYAISIYCTFAGAGGISIPVVMHHRRMQGMS